MSIALKKRMNRYSWLDDALYVHYMAKSMWTPHHHLHMWFFPKLSPPNWKLSLDRKSLYDVALKIAFTGTNGANLFQYDSKAIFKKALIARLNVEEIEWPS